MKATELISQLKHLIDKYGDREVKIRGRGADLYETVYYDKIEKVDCDKIKIWPDEPKDVFVLLC